MAQPSDATALTEEVLPAGWQMIDLPGHAFAMTGFRTAEDVVYLADCLSSEATLDKYQINFLVDVQSYLDTLERVKQMSARVFIPAHAEPTEEIAPLAQKNIDKVREIAERILDICAEPAEPGYILKQLFDGYGLTMNFEQYVLTGSTIRSYLAWLADQGQIEADFSQNTLLWRRL